jgi:nucleoside-diphosphate-sugar epimerase
VAEELSVLVTGATGFVGRALVARLRAEPGIAVTAAARRTSSDVPDGVNVVHVADLGPDTDWTGAVVGQAVVVHAAARVHVMRDSAADPLAEFRRTNVEGTLALARQAATAGVRRFVFISSIKVNGEATRPGHPFTTNDQPAPVDPYGISKAEAEQGLREIAEATGLEVVIIRPVLVYGRGVRANFRAMMRWVESGMPLPLGAVNNARSIVGVDNLVDLISVCLTHPAAANQTLLVSDGEDLSTAELLRRVGVALDKPARLIPVPVPLLQAAARLVGRGDVAQRLCGSLQVDIVKTQQLLGWTPPVSVAESLRRAALSLRAEP